MTPKEWAVRGRSRIGGAHIEALVALFPDPLLYADGRSGEILDANAAAEDLAGYGANELRGESLDSLTPAAAVHGVPVRSWDALVAAAGLHEEVPLRRRDGSCFVGSVSVSPIADEAGTGILLFLRDPTARRLLERELITKHVALRDAYEELAAVNQQLQRKNDELEATRSVVSQLEQMATIGRFAAGVAHEVNNPLAFVMENLRLLLEHAGYLQPVVEREARRVASPRLGRVAKELQDLLAESLQGAERVRDIVRQLHAFSNTEDRQHELASLEEIVESALTMVQNQARQAARLERDYVDVSAVACVPGQLVQVVVNLLINAIHALEGVPRDRARMVVRIRPRGEQVMLEVEDTGCGIDSELVDKVFDPFFTTKRAGKGSGLGLSISTRIVQQHGGSLALDSRSGLGTTARLLLPRAKSPGGTTRVQVSTTKLAAHRLRLLFIDDEELLLRALARRYGGEHDVTTAGCTEEAYAACEQHGPFDLVLIDMMMPELSGPELLEELAKRFHWLLPQVAFMSGGVFSERISDSASRQHVPVIRKPIDAADLRRLLEERGPTLLASGRPGPTTLASGRPGPTTLASGRRGPTTLASGRPGPTTLASGRQGPAETS